MGAKQCTLSIQFAYYLVCVIWWLLSKYLHKLRGRDPVFKFYQIIWHFWDLDFHDTDEHALKMALLIKNSLHGTSHHTSSNLCSSLCDFSHQWQSSVCHVILPQPGGEERWFEGNHWGKKNIVYFMWSSKPRKWKCESFKRGVCGHLPIEESNLQSMVIAVPLNSTVSLSQEFDVHTDVKK